MDKVIAFATLLVGTCAIVIRSLLKKVKKQQTEIDRQMETITQTKSTIEKASSTVEKRNEINEEYKKELTQEEGEGLSDGILDLASAFYHRLQDGEGSQHED